MVGLALLLAVGLASIGTYLDARIRAMAAADAAALAAAPVTFLPFGAEGTPAEEAARFARLNGFDMVACDCPVDRTLEPRTVTVEVARAVHIWPIGGVEVSAISRAEFVPARLLDRSL